MIVNYKKFILESKVYNNINNIDEIDGELEYYQIPFSLFTNNICINGDDNFVLCFSNNNFVYDYISDNDITVALIKNLSEIDISTDWENIKKTGNLNMNQHIQIKKSIYLELLNWFKKFKMEKK